MNSLRNFKRFSMASHWKPKIPKHYIVFDKSTYRSPHPVWNPKDAEQVEITHFKPKTIRDYIAYYFMKTLRTSFDFLTGYRPGKMNESLYLKRIIFLETIAGVPGMIGGMMRHLASLRSLREDGGWIHHLLEEAENERMHLLTFLRVRQPGFLLRLGVMSSQFIFFWTYSAMYVISPKFCHRFVGYLEEEAVKTYSNLLKELDEGQLPVWSELRAPITAIKYWGLKEDSQMRDVIIAIRADEVFHREFNHHFADVPPDHPIEGHKYKVAEGAKIWDDGNNTMHMIDTKSKTTDSSI